MPEQYVPTKNSNKSTVPTDKAKSPRGTVRICNYILEKKNKKGRTVYCKLCTYSFAGVRVIYEHHHSDHGIQFCSVCQKGFNTQTALDKHSYSHGEKKYVYEVCGQSFPFASQMEQHKIKHRDVQLYCMHNQCGKFFKSFGDLNRHVCQHDTKFFYHCDYCRYKNVDQ